MDIILSTYSSYVLFVLVGIQRSADARIDYRCETCRLALFPVMLVSTYLVFSHIVGLVGTKDLGYESS